MSFVNLATLRNEHANAKSLVYLAFTLNSAADQVKAVLDVGAPLLGDDSFEKLWQLYIELKQSAITLEAPFDITCRVEHGQLHGPGGGFAHLDSTVDCLEEYRKFRESYEEQ